MKKYLARIVLEAETPLHVGSGSSDLTLDAPINCDANGLPQINGTSLAGVIRSHFKKDEEFINRIFGFQAKQDGAGSRLVVSNAHLIYEKGKVVEGPIPNNEITESEYLKAMQAYALPLRDHCRINEKGAAKDQGKFDNCVLPKGVRFVCELELTENDENLSADWDKLLKVVCSDTFRVGGKVRSGLGRLKVHECLEKPFDFQNPDDVEEYLAHSSSFKEKTAWKTELKSGGNSDKYFCYILKIQPEDFFTFGSGYGDEIVDMTPKKEIVVKWNGDTPEISEAKILVPASSIKGAISHRTAFYYNKFTENYVENFKGEKDKPNEAVKTLFGYQEGNDVAVGKVFFDDMIIEENIDEKVFDHVSIDRFTGGAINGALFDEKVCVNSVKVEPDKFEPLEFKPIKIYVEKSALSKEVDPDGNIKKAFKQALEDICTGMLPLGGSTMRGHGCFTGTLEELEGNNE